MGKLKNNNLSARKCLEEYRKHINEYLPMIDHERKIFPIRTEEGDLNIGWDCGFIGNRPYFLECWAAEGLTMMTIFLSTKGIEDISISELEKLLIEDAEIYSKREGYMSPDPVPKFTDGNGNEFYSINILVGVNDEPAVIEGGGILSPFRVLNDLNGYLDK